MVNEEGLYRDLVLSNALLRHQYLPMKTAPAAREQDRANSSDRRKGARCKRYDAFEILASFVSH